jgi:Ribbon-helix-helix protein, copG family
MLTSLRLDAKTDRAVRALARRTGRTKSQVIRDAIERLVRAESETDATSSVYDEWADVIGCAAGGPGDLSERTGEKFRAVLVARRRR